MEISGSDKERIMQYFKDKEFINSKFHNLIIYNEFAKGSQCKVFDISSASFKKNEYVLKIYIDSYDSNNRIAFKASKSYNKQVGTIKKIRDIFEGDLKKYYIDIEYNDVIKIDGHTYYIIIEKKYKFLDTELQLCINDQNEMVDACMEIAVSLLPVLSKIENRFRHRDIKPQNIFLLGNSISDGLGLTDFGIVTNVDEKGNDTTVIGAGTYNTMAPEYCVERKSPEYEDKTKADMFSLGIVMYLCLNKGNYPLDDAKYRDRLKTDSKDPSMDFALESPPYGSEELKAIVIKATQLNPRDRFKNCMEMLEAISETPEYKAKSWKHGIVTNTNSNPHLIDKLKLKIRRLFGLQKQTNCIFALIAVICLVSGIVLSIINMTPVSGEMGDVSYSYHNGEMEIAVDENVTANDFVKILEMSENSNLLKKTDKLIVTGAGETVDQQFLSIFKNIEDVDFSEYSGHIICESGKIIKNGDELVMVLPQYKSDTLEITEDIRSIAPNAFENCYNIKKVVIESPIAEFDGKLFNSLVDLEQITVENTNSEYYVDNNVLYKKGDLGLDTLIKVPSKYSNKELNISTQTAYIDENAFAYDSKNTKLNNIEHVYIPEYLKKSEFEKLKGLVSAENFFIDKNNEHYVTDDEGAVFEIEKFENHKNYELIFVPRDFEKSSYTIFEKAGYMLNAGDTISVSAGAFENAKEIRELIISEFVNYIDTDALSEIPGLTNIEISKDNKIYSMGEADDFCGSLIYTEYNNKNEATSKKLLTVIGADLLDEYIIPDEVNYIEEGALSGVSNIKKIVLSSNIKAIDPKVFDSMKNLESIEIYNNDKYESKNGELLEKINKKGSEADEEYSLLKVPAKFKMDKYIVPNRTKTISKEAFYSEDGTIKINKIVLPQSLGKIDESIFDDLRCLKEFKVAIGNEIYSTDKYGVLYYENILIKYPAKMKAKEFFIREGTTSVSENAPCKVKNKRGENENKALKVTYLGIPASLKNIHPNNLASLKHVKNIVVDEDNTVFTVVDNNLYSKDKTTLYKMAAKWYRFIFEIPETVKYIEEYAISKSYFTFYVKINYMIEDLPLSFFDSFPSAIYFSVDEYNVNYANDKSGAVYNNNFEDLVKVPNGRLLGYTVADEAKNINKHAFSGCHMLGKLKIGLNVENISEKAFEDCKTGIMVEASSNNSSEYYDYKGTLINSEKDRVICLKSCWYSEIPDNVNSISRFALTPAANGKSDKYTQYAILDADIKSEEIHIKEGTTLIRDNFCEGAKNVKRVYIPSSIKNMGANSFSGCTGIEEVYYGGTNESWIALMNDNKDCFLNNNENIKVFFGYTE